MRGAKRYSLQNPRTHPPTLHGAAVPRHQQTFRSCPTWRSSWKICRQKQADHGPLPMWGAPNDPSGEAQRNHQVAKVDAGDGNDKVHALGFERVLQEGAVGGAVVHLLFWSRPSPQCRSRIYCFSEQYATICHPLVWFRQSIQERKSSVVGLEAAHATETRAESMGDPPLITRPNEPACIKGRDSFGPTNYQNLPR
jgi:hypothetical protein